MNTPPKKVTQIGTTVSKLKDEDSPLFKYIDSLSPIKSAKSIPITHSLSFSSPPSVFTSPHAASHKESRFRSHNNSFNPSKDDSASNAEVASTREEKEETEPPQVPLHDCTTPRDINNEGNNGCCEDGGMDLQKMCDNVKPRSEPPDWEPLISGPMEMIYGSTNESEAFSGLLEQRRSDSLERLCGSAVPTLEPVSKSNVGAHHEMELSDVLSILHRGVRRRCLDFEPRGRNNQTLGESPLRCAVPSIGLHLNAMQMSSSNINVGNDYSVSGSITPVLHSQDIVRDNETGIDAGQVVEEASALEELNPNSLKKKRRKSEQAGEGKSCKRCNCKKSKCLKLYCECFAAGDYCIEPCSCVDCFNKPIHKDIVEATRKQIESRNPLAFAPKVIRNSDSMVEAGEDPSKTPASARHKRGCNCKKSSCLKKYCECYQSGVGCSINCRCEGCKNAFGRKDGSSFVGTDIEYNDENETSGENRTANTQQNVELFNSAPPSRPMPLRQPLAQLPTSSINNLVIQQSHHHHHLHGAYGSSLYNIQSFRQQDMSLLYRSRIETIIEEGTEDMENLIQSPINSFNGVSPSSERVYMPHLNASEATPMKRDGTRRLLQSIPAFPSLTPNH